MHNFTRMPGLLLALLPVIGLATETPPPERHAFFGGLHVHTGWSFDTYQKGLISTPADAYRFARGETIRHVDGEPIKLHSGPLDFLAVTEHAEYLGFGRTLKLDTDSPLYETDFASRDRSPSPPIVVEARLKLQATLNTNKPNPDLVTPELRRYPWQKIIELADKYYEPEKFTTFVGFEWTSQPDRANLHRVVLFGNDNALPDYPFSAFDSEDPTDLWDWLDEKRSNGANVLAIPHNSNQSDGLAFPAEPATADKLLAYAEQRQRNEPLVEIMQVKGASETHPSLSPNDEWADFEINEVIPTMGKSRVSATRGSYVRDAWLNGLRLEQQTGVNPYGFGVIAASDTHSTAAPYEEDKYFGSKGAEDITAELRLRVTDMPPPSTGIFRAIRQPLDRSLVRSGAGLAGVWAEKNTRAALFAALERKETFGTSGPRIRVRFFGGWNFAAEDAVNEKTMAAVGYSEGTHMGGRLPPMPAGASAPRFLLAALMDPNSAPLQRVQVIKGWLENGALREQVYDVQCADGAQPNEQTHRCPDNGARVNLEDCSYPLNTGLLGMNGFWKDPDFAVEEPAFYYVRVLENPTCRWSSWDAVRLGIEIPEGAPATIQERAWSSPIWYTPANNKNL